MVFEIESLSRALADEQKLRKDQTIYGFFPEVYDEILGERFPSQMRLWNKTKRTLSVGAASEDITRGAFGGAGVDSVIDREGRIVFRGGDTDGLTYFSARYALDRLLDDGFDSAIRQEFRK